MCLAVPGKIIEIIEESEFARLGVVDFEGLRKEANLSFTPEAQVGDYVLVHVGFSISTINEREARRVFEALRELEELEEIENMPNPAPSEGRA